MAGKKTKIGNIPRRNGKAKFNLIGLFKSIKWTKRTRLFALIGIVAVLLLAFSFRGVGADVMTKSCVGVEGQCFEEDYPVLIGDAVKFNLKFIDSKSKKEISSPAVTAKITSSNCYAKDTQDHPKGGCIIESKTENLTGTNFVSLYQIEKRTYKDSALLKTTITYFPGYKSKTLTNTVSSQWRSAVYTTKDSAGKTLSISVKSPFTYTIDKSKAESAIKTINGKTFTNSTSRVTTAVSNLKTAVAVSNSKATVAVSNKVKSVVNTAQLNSCNSQLKKYQTRMAYTLNAKETEQNLGFWATFGDRYLGQNHSKTVTLREMVRSIDPDLAQSDVVIGWIYNSSVAKKNLKYCQLQVGYVKNIDTTTRRAIIAYSQKKGIDAVKAEARIVKQRNVTAIVMIAAAAVATGGYALSAAPTALSLPALEYAGGQVAVRAALPSVLRALPGSGGVIIEMVKNASGVWVAL